MLTGAELNSMSDDALCHRARETDLFVEVDPHQKERIVRALQRGGATVGYLGDGINDAPSLRHADVGISVDGAVDVARDSADVVMLEPDLEVLQRGVEEGRRSFANTMKYIRITTSANFGNMISMALAVLFLPFLPLAAKQILLNNLLSDIPSIAISTDRVDASQIMSPQHWDLGELRRFMIVFGLLSSAFDLLTFWILRAVLHADMATFQTAWFTVSLLTELAVLLVLRSDRALWRTRPSGALVGSSAAVAALALAVPLLPGLPTQLGFTVLSAATMAAVIGVVLAYVVSTEAVKRLMARPGTA
jgi:Mg2+-importing ATPase